MPRHLRLPFLVLTMLASTSGLAAQLQTGSGDTARVYRFEPRVEDGPGDLHGQALGRISVLRANGHEVYAEDTPLQAGCGEIAAVSQLTPQLVALCGTLGGRHTTYKVFRQVGAALEMATLDLQDGSGPLAIRRDGRARGVVMRRDVFPGITGPRYFPLVYALYDDPIAFGFRPDFSSYARADYHRRYNELRQGAQPAQAMPEILAMLLAMQEPRLTCRELSRLETILIDDGQYAVRPDARDFLRLWMDKLPSAGYPAFDEAVCKDY